MESLKELARSLGLVESSPPGIILLQRDLAELFQQRGLAGGSKEDLGLCKVCQFPSGLTAADSSLAAAQVFKQAFQLQVILWQAGDIVTGEQFFPAKLPAFAEGGEHQILGTLGNRIRVVGGDPLVYIGGDLLPGKVKVAMGRAVGWVVETICDLKQTLMSILQIGSQLPIVLQGAVELE